MIRIVNEDGTIVEREPTEAELEQAQKDRVIIDAENAQLIAKRQARQSALTKLTALGLTEDEIAAL